MPRIPPAGRTPREDIKGFVVDDEPLLSLPPSVGALVVAAWIICSMVGTAWWAASDNGFWFLAGSLACLTVSVPLAFRDYEILSPWSLIIGVVYLAGGVRGMFIALQIEGSRSLDELFFLGHGSGYFVRPAVVYLLGLALLTAGYLVAAPPLGRTRRRPIIGAASHTRPERVLFVVIASAALGALGFVLFTQSTGGLDLSNISAKRTMVSVNERIEAYRSHGEYRFLTTFATIAFWLQLAEYNYRRVRHGVGTPRGWWLVLLFLNACLLPVYASSRAELLFTVLGALIIVYCMGGLRVRLGPIVLGIAVAIVCAALMTELRDSKYEGEGGFEFDSSAVVDTFVLTRSLADVATSTHVIEAVPQNLPYSHGQTISVWLLAPVPRSVWPEKPIIHSGPQVGAAVYNNPYSGVPPGLIAEAYWSFGIIGVVTIPLLCGAFLRRLGGYWRPLAKDSPAAAMMMAAVAVPTGVVMFANSIGAALFQIFITLLLLTPIVAFIGASRPTSNDSAQHERAIA